MLNRLSTKQKKKKGFTLIELIIVIAIMAILAAIAVPNFASIRNNSRYKADVQSLETIKRTTLTLVADGTIKPTVAADEVKFVFAGNGAASTPTNTTAAIGLIFDSAMKDVKKVQYGKKITYTLAAGYAKDDTNAGTQYTVKISKDGDVTAEVLD